MNKITDINPAFTEKDSDAKKHSLAWEASPILVRLSSKVVLSSNTFTNNSAIFTGNINFGNTISFHHMLGFHNISISDSTIKD